MDSLGLQDRDADFWRAVGEAKGGASIPDVLVKAMAPSQRDAWSRIAEGKGRVWKEEVLLGESGTLADSINKRGREREGGGGEGRKAVEFEPTKPPVPQRGRTTAIKLKERTGDGRGIS